MPSQRKAQLDKKSKRAALKPFPTLLLRWDSEVPNLDLAVDRTKATSRYYGYEVVPGRVGWIQDCVELGPEGTEEDLPAPLVVPQGYWVPLVMLNWSITVNQHLRGRMLELAESTNNKRRKAKCVEWGLICLQRLWWYIRCRGRVRADLKSHRKSDPAPEVVGSLNELLWREWNNWIEEEVPGNRTSAGIIAQQGVFGSLFSSKGGFIGEWAFLSAELHP